MVNGFEDETEGLNEYELNELLPKIVAKLSLNKGIEKAVTGKHIISALSSRGYKKVDGARLRKIINYIRRKDLISCLIASSKGYYVAIDNENVIRFIDSLKQRENAIRTVRLSMQRQLEFKTNIEFQFPEL